MLAVFAPLQRPLVLVASLVLIGTAGYILIDEYTPFDALYMTVITLATVGYGEVKPLSFGGRLFTIALIIFGTAGVLLTLTEMFRIVYEGQIGRVLWRRRMQLSVSQLNQHFILCGFGRVGRQIAADLSRAQAPFLVVDIQPSILQAASELGFLVVQGDASHDATLRAAGIERARALITAVADDADNLIVSLSARALNAGLLIVSRADSDEAIPKLERAGANRVVSPYDIGGRRMAMLALRPLSVEFVDSVFHGGAGGEALIEDIEVRPGSRLATCTVDEVQRSLAPGVSILAIKRAAAIMPRPSPETALQPGDELVAIGGPDQLALLERLTEGASSSA